MTRISVLVAILLVGAVGLWLAVDRPGATLGPVDGSDLPPADTGRVAVGDRAPDFTLMSRRGERVALSDFRGEKDVVLVFYRGHW